MGVSKQGTLEALQSKSEQGERTVVSASEQLRRRRSRQYLDALTAMDAGGHLHCSEAVSKLRDVIAAEFPNGPGTWPLGWLGKCYLGGSYEVHTLDFTGQIVRHFKRGEALPDGFERARSLAGGGQYALIEVFSDQLVAIAQDGSTSVLTS
ncbi:hypothetical protein [Brevundimonas sp.]|uniref:hypothetical protein n=1 Tax=Brevundimonas sp. TaxID=1871086 RepID=UPI0028985818|nr:hypothetical protein [Brevundimonas sp.]